MTALLSLTASAEAFEHIGLDHDALCCRNMARDCAGMAEAIGEDAANALYRHWASEMAERATVKAIEFNSSTGTGVSAEQAAPASFEGDVA